MVVAVRTVSGGRQLPVMTVVAGFSQPAPGIPVLFTHSKAETLFHEIGHVTHHMSDTHDDTSTHLHHLNSSSSAYDSLYWLCSSLCVCVSVSVAPGISICPELVASWTSLSCPASCSRTSSGTTEYCATSPSTIEQEKSSHRRWWTTYQEAGDSSLLSTHALRLSWYARHGRGKSLLKARLL